jgi:bzd-type benzoyl-CoA reductase Q subunit
MSEKKEYWRWEESNWHNPDLDCKKAGIVTAGVDIGSVSSQAVVICDGELCAYSNMRTGSDSPNSALKAINWALKGTGLTLEDIHYTVGTGYGRVNVPFAGSAITEISCHALGCTFMYGPTVRTILDMGGQDCKVIHCDGRGKVISFLMNDKCAAGTGRGLEVFADLLSVPIGEVGRRSLDVEEEPEPVSSTCVVFAKTEAIGLLRSGWSIERVLAAYCSAMARRVVSLLNRIGMEEDFAITGGIAKNSGIVTRLEKELGVKALKPRYDTQLAGAIGAALFGKAIVEKRRKKNNNQKA